MMQISTCTYNQCVCISVNHSKSIKCYILSLFSISFSFWKGSVNMLKYCQRTEELYSLVADLRDTELLKEIAKGM